MSNLDIFIKTVAQRLGVEQDSGEQTESWGARVVFSAVGLMSSACLWDKETLVYDDAGNLIANYCKSVGEKDFIGVSKVYWKRYAKKLLYAYCSKFPVGKNFPGNVDVDIEKLISSVYIRDMQNPMKEHDDEGDGKESIPKKTNWEDLLHEMLDLYIQTGVYYNKDYWVGPSIPRRMFFGKNEKGQDVYLERGFMPRSLGDGGVNSAGINERGRQNCYKTPFVSGLGMWTNDKATPKPNDAFDFAEVFGLQSESFLKLYEELERRFQQGAEVNGDILNDLRYLRTSPEKSKMWGAYWLYREPKEKSNFLGLARYGNQGAERYFLYRRDGKKLYRLDLRDYETNPDFSRPYRGSREYIRIALALLAKRGTLPPIRATLREHSVDVRLGYLLPPQEHSFFKLYSWPLNGFTTVGQNWDRKIARDLYRPFKAYWERLGFTVEETDGSKTAQ